MKSIIIAMIFLAISVHGVAAQTPTPTEPTPLLQPYEYNTEDVPSPLDGISLLGSPEISSTEEISGTMGTSSVVPPVTPNVIVMAGNTILTIYNLAADNPSWLLYIGLLLIALAIRVGLRLLFKPPEV